jgi:hypothetical protein
MLTLNTSLVWEELCGEYYATAQLVYGLCVFYMPRSRKWHFVAWRLDGSTDDGYIYDTSNGKERHGYGDMQSARSAAEQWGRYPVLNVRRKAS